MVDNFKNLDLNRERIIEAIKEFFETKPDLDAKVDDELQLITPAQGLRRCTISTNNGDFFLDMYYLKTKKTTLHSKNGDSQFSELKLELCRYVAENCKNGMTHEAKRNPWFSAENIDYEDVDSVISLIKESSFYDGELPPSPGNGYPTWKFKGVQKETLTITYFNKSKAGVGKLLLQGKPEFLFLESIELITQLFDTNEISTKLNESGFFESQIDDVIIQKDILSILPNAFDKLPSEQLKKTVKQALIFKNFKSNWYDFTVYTFNAYRALEGHYRYILSESNINYAGHSVSIWQDSIGEDNYPRILKGNHAESVNQKYGDKSEDFTKYLTDVNRIINDERNSYFHWKKFEHGLPLDETALVEDEGVAKSIIMNCLTQIEKYYKLFC